MGEAADLDRGLWPSAKPVGSHFSVIEIIPQILALLEKHDIHVTYFVESWNLLVYPDTIDAIARAGHEIAWHAWRHEAWSKLDETAEQTNFIRSFGDEGLEGLDYISPAAEQAAMVKSNSNEDLIAILPFRWTTVDALYYMEVFGKLRKLKGFPREEPLTPTELTQKYIDQINETIEHGGFLSLLFHPFLTTSSERIEAMEAIIKYLARKRDEGVVPVPVLVLEPLRDVLQAEVEAMQSTPRSTPVKWIDVYPPPY
ncbi:hypothetical protein DL768_010643 [Monosporascus sp. mg162]|nr:hypothetical protein DL768_010643 [Monosporascus sp. mg162]